MTQWTLPCATTLHEHVHAIWRRTFSISRTASRQKQKVCVHLLLFTVTEISLSYVVTITLHCCDTNTSLFQKEKEKEMNPWDQFHPIFYLFSLSLQSVLLRSHKVGNCFTNSIRASVDISFFKIIFKYVLKNMMHNVYNPLQTCKTRHKLPTTLSCHMQNYSALCGRTMHAAVQKNTATVPLSKSQIHCLYKHCLKIQGLVYHISFPLPHIALVSAHLYTSKESAKGSSKFHWHISNIYQTTWHKSHPKIWLPSLQIKVYVNLIFIFWWPHLIWVRLGVCGRLLEHNNKIKYW